MIIEINKDIDNYKESVVMGLTARQLIYSVLSVIVGGIVVLLTYKYVGLTISTYIAVPLVAPIALSGFYSYQGLTFMQMMKKKLQFAFYNPTLTYVSTEGEGELAEIIKQETKENTDKKKSGKKKDDFQKARKNMLMMMVLLLCMIVAFAGFAVWFKYYR